MPPADIIAEDVRSYYMAVHNTMVGRGERTNDKGQVVSFRIAHFGLAAENERIDFMVDITKKFIKKQKYDPKS